MKNINEEFIKYLSSKVGKEFGKMITQDSLAKKVNCTSVSMSRYLNQQREIPVEILFRIKKELNISDEEFMQFYQEYSITKCQKNKDELDEKFKNLTADNQIKLLEYANYLLFQQNNSQEEEKNLTHKKL